MRNRICSFVGLVAVACTIAACSGKTEPAEVVISLNEAVQPLTSASVIVDYSGAAAKPQIAGGEPACFVLPPDVTGEFSDDGAGHLTINVTARRAFAAPIDLAVCRMIPDSAGVAAATISSRLKVSLAGATDTKGAELDDRRLAMARSGGRDVTSAAPDGTAAIGDSDNDSGMKVDRESMGSAGNSGATGSGTSSGAASLGDALRQRNTGNAAKEIEREAERARREAEKTQRNARDTAGSAAQSSQGGGDDGDIDGAADPDAENDPGVSSATPSYDVTVEIMNNAGLIGALQFDLNHTGSSGGWQGSGASVRCSWRVSGGITACNDVSSGRARCALADISGFQTPSPIVTCIFKTNEPLSASDFSVQVVDASTPDFKPASVNMAITSVVQR